MPVNFPIDTLYRAASLHPGSIAVHCDETEYAYESLSEGGRSIGRAFARRGMVFGEHVAVYSPNHPNLILGLFAVWSVGAVWIPANTEYPPASVVRYLAPLEPSWLLYHSDYGYSVREIVAALPSIKSLICIDRHDGEVSSFDDLMQETENVHGEPASASSFPRCVDQVIAFFPTSGTTGEPKAIGWNAERINADTALFQRMYKGDVHIRLVFTPLAHGAFHLAINTLAVGGKVVLMRQFVPEKALELMAKQMVTNVLLPGSALTALLAHPQLNMWKYGNVRDITIAMDAPSVSTLRRAVEIFGPCVSVIYGQTETGLLTMLDAASVGRAIAENRADWLRSCGQPGPSVTVAVMDDEGRTLPPGEIGEIVARTDRVSMPEGAWHHTNDLGWIDEEGFMYLAGRKDDVININGYKVHPAEVEACISDLSSVLDCAVAGISERRSGLILAAVVRPVDGAAFAEQDVIRYVRSELGAVKVPRLILATSEALPRTRNGRLDRRAVAIQYGPLFQQMLLRARPDCS